MGFYLRESMVDESIFSYGSGIFFAVLVWLYTTIWRVIDVKWSKYSRNLAKIGLQQTLFTVETVAMPAGAVSPKVKIWKILLLFAVGFPFIFASWGYIVYVVAQFFWGRMKKADMPEKLKEAAWFMRNTDMTFDQVVERMHAADAVPGQDFYDFRHGLIEDMKARGIPMPYGIRPRPTAAAGDYSE